MRTGVQRFAEKVLLPVTPSGCWLWKGSIGDGGYSDFYYDGKSGRGHRFSYETFVGPIPTGHHIDHLCRNRECVNPAHLEAVTPRVNALRGVAPTAVNASKVSCDHGHPLSGVNLYIDKGKRRCRQCGALRSRKYRSRLKGVANEVPA